MNRITSCFTIGFALVFAIACGGGGNSGNIGAEKKELSATPQAVLSQVAESQTNVSQAAYSEVNDAIGARAEAAGSEKREFFVLLGGEAIENEGIGIEARALTSPGMESLADPGNPDLPARIVRVNLGRGIIPETVKVEVLESAESEEATLFPVAPARPVVAMVYDEATGEWLSLENFGEGKEIVEGMNRKVYGLDAYFPEKHVEEGKPVLEGEDFNICLRYAPVLYNPQRSILRKSTRLHIKITCSAAPAAEGRAKAAANDAKGYAIITTANLSKNCANLASFKAHKESLGYGVSLATMEGLASEPGSVPQEKIRSWLKRNRAALNLKYVLLIGDPRPGVTDSVPMLRCWPRYGTKHYPDYQDCLTDAYYAELDANWDKDGDGRIGEFNGDGWEDMLGFDIAVGRIPYYGDPRVVDDYLARAQAYEKETDTSWRKRFLLALARLDDQTLGADMPLYMASEVCAPAGFALKTLSDRPIAGRDGVLNMTNFYAELKGQTGPGYGMVMWEGHGASNRTVCKYDDFVNSASFPVPARQSFYFQMSCHNGAPQSSTNLGFTIMQKAAGTVSASTVGWYTPGLWTPKDLTHGVGYHMYRRMILEKLSIGEALNGSKLQCCRYSECSWMLALVFNIYGDPSLSHERPAAADRAAPTAAISEPESAIIRGSSVTLRGTAADASRIVSVKVNGVDALPLEPGFGRWEIGFAQIGPGQKVFTVRTEDELGNADASAATRTITFVRNTAPTANAGADQAVESGALVKLDAGASGDADGDTLSFSWAQVSGETVAISSASSRLASFTAPAKTGTLVFRLSVNDGWDSASDEMKVEVKAADRYPLYAIVDVSKGPAAASYPVHYTNDRPALSGAGADPYKGGLIALRFIPSGNFLMGSPSKEVGRAMNEALRPVTLTKGFYLGVFEVTQGQYRSVMGENAVEKYKYAKSYLGDKLPVGWLTWKELRGNVDPAAAVSGDSFLKRLSDKTGLRMDLPTEAQWEYACRAGTSGALNNGAVNLVPSITTYKFTQDPNLVLLARYAANSNGSALAVGMKQPNAWDLYDMHGNIMEMCLDYHSYSTARGAETDPLWVKNLAPRKEPPTVTVKSGSFCSWGATCRSAFRMSVHASDPAADARNIWLGFRICAKP